MARSSDRKKAHQTKPTYQCQMPGLVSEGRLWCGGNQTFFLGGVTDTHKKRYGERGVVWVCPVEATQRNAIRTTTLQFENPNIAIAPLAPPPTHAHH